MHKIVRGSRISLQDQILRAIVKDVEDGTLRPGDQLPPERALAEATGASLAPVRAALKQFELAGYLTRTQGRGTFVAERPVQYELRLMSSSTDSLRRAGVTFEVDVVDQSIAIPPAEAAKRLNLEPQSSAFHLLRVVTVRDAPSILLESWVGEAFMGDLVNDEIFDRGGSLYGALRKNGVEQRPRCRAGQRPQTAGVGGGSARDAVRHPAARPHLGHLHPGRHGDRLVARPVRLRSVLPGHGHLSPCPVVERHGMDRLTELRTSIAENTVPGGSAYGRAAAEVIALTLRGEHRERRRVGGLMRGTAQWLVDDQAVDDQHAAVTRARRSDVGPHRAPAAVVEAMREFIARVRDVDREGRPARRYLRQIRGRRCCSTPTADRCCSS